VAGAVFSVLVFFVGRGVHQISQAAPTPSPPIKKSRILGFSRFHFLQRPLCKVESKLCTEKSIPIASQQGYALATVDKFWIWAVDNWVGWEKSGGESARGAGGRFQGYLHLIDNALSIAFDL
jgi:hypothetical protein